MKNPESLQVLDIGYITVLYFTLGYFVSIFMNKIVGPFDEKKADQKSMGRIFLEVLAHVYVIGLIIYYLRKLVVEIPSPFQGINGFDHNRVPELKSSFVLSFIVLYYQRNLKYKLDYFAKRMLE
jgi:hypothetical protein